MINSKFCLVYTDLLLDDLCALEKLSEHYDGVFIYPYAPERIGQPDNEYASANIASLEEAIATLKVWFGFAAEVGERGMEAVHPLVTDVFVLCALTDVVRHLKKFPTLADHDFCLMAGSKPGADYCQPTEWNQQLDPEAYNEFFSLVRPSRVKQYTNTELEKLGDTADGSMEFYAEYVTRMGEIKDIPYCPDLVAVQLYLQQDVSNVKGQHPLSQMKNQMEYSANLSKLDLM